MHRALFIGNSHLATIKAAEENSVFPASYVGYSFQPNFNIDAFENTATGDGFQLPLDAPEDQVELWRLTTGLTGPMELAGFDVFVVVGVLDPPNPWKMLAPQQWLRFKDSQIVTPISYGSYSDIMESLHRADIRSANYIRAVIRRNDPSRPIYFVPRPHIRDDAGAFDHKYAPPDSWAHLTKDERRVLCDSENTFHTKFFSSYGIDSLLPPSELVSRGNMCPSAFSTGALGSPNFRSGLDPQWGNSDLYHKNIEYGRYWRLALNRLIESKLIEKQIPPRRWD